MAKGTDAELKRLVDSLLNPNVFNPRNNRSSYPQAWPMSTRSTSDDGYVLVVALDFGTTYSGYAFSFKTSKEVIHMNRSWGSELGFQSYKTPTCLLLHHGKFKSFGFQAQRDYANVLEKCDTDYCFFEKFKMTLHNDKVLARSTVLTATNGEEMPAIDVITMCLDYLKQQVLQAVSKQVAGIVNSDLIRWVITVPAIWSDKSKQFMRETAFKAGLISELSSNKLFIALEPEAASLYCRTLPINQFIGHKADTGNLRLPEEAKYMVVDAGGGTLDCTIHEVLPGNTVKELYKATGGPWGGTKVDDKFEELFEEILSDDFLFKFQREFASQWLQLMIDFEQKKKAAKPDSDAHTNITISYGLGLEYHKFAKQDINKAFDKVKSKGVSFSASGHVVFKPTAMAALFNPITSRIASHVSNLLKNNLLSGISHVFLVGGFSECTYLQQAVKSVIDNNISLLIPEDASLSVIKGAVMFGHDPHLISSRISRKAYYINSHRKFEPGIDDPARKKTIPGVGDRVPILRSFIEQGQSVPVGFIHKHVFHPMRSDQKTIGFKVYCSDRNYITDPHDPEVKVHGNISVFSPDTRLGRKRDIEVCMIFGGTEIVVQGKDTTDPEGKLSATTLEFLDFKG